MRRHAPALVALLAVLAVLASACSPQSTSQDQKGTRLSDTFEIDELVIENVDGSRHRFDVYLALNFEQQRRGEST